MKLSDTGWMVGTATACGPRFDNQDVTALDLEWGVFALADGMGGLADGREAAATAVDAVIEQAQALSEGVREGRKEHGAAVVEVLEQAIRRASDAVRRATVLRHAPARPPRSGCTLTVAVLVDSTAYVAHIGDSRAYRVRADGAEQLTEDHSVAAARVRRGLMSEIDAALSPLRNKLYQAVGISEELMVDILSVELQPGDRLVLCSDGLWDRVSLSEMGAVVMGRAPRAAADLLVSVARQNGFTDNTTAMVIDPGRQEAGHAAASALGRHALFAECTPAVLRHIAPYLDRRVFEPGEILMQEGEPDGALYLWASGEVDWIRQGRDGGSVHGPAQRGALSLVRDGTAGETVTARTRVRALRLHPDTLRAMIERQPELGAQVSLALARQLAHRVVDLSALLPVDPEA